MLQGEPDRRNFCGKNRSPRSLIFLTKAFRRKLLICVHEAKNADLSTFKCWLEHLRRVQPTSSACHLADAGAARMSMATLRTKRRIGLMVAAVSIVFLSFTVFPRLGRAFLPPSVVPPQFDALYNLTSVVAAEQPLSCGRNCLVPPERLLIVSIGSLERPEYLEAQRATIGALVSFKGYTEHDIPSCVVCDSKAVMSTSQYDRLFHGLERQRDQEEVFFSKPLGWWCAQKRNLPALRLALQHITTLPEFLLMIDDDTFVHTPNLIEKLKWIDISKPVFWARRIVDPKWKPLYILGGGGWLVSRTVLHSLLKPFDHLATSYHFQNGQLAAQQLEKAKTLLEVCIEKQNGGSWCFDHSDHAVPHCIFMASQVEAHSQADLHQEACQQTDMLPGDASLLPANTSWDTLLTCHYATPTIQTSLFHAHVSPQM